MKPGKLRLITGFFIIFILLISIFFVFTPNANTTLYEGEIDLTEQEALEMIEGLYTDITTYTSIDSILGYYQQSQEQRSIQQIAIQFHPKFSTAFQLSETFIEISDGIENRILYFNKDVEELTPYDLFHHPLWNTIKNESYGILTILDNDLSMIEYNILNENTDRAYLIFNIPQSMILEKGDVIDISLYPSTGMKKTLEITITFSIQPLVKLL